MRKYSLQNKSNKDFNKQVSDQIKCPNNLRIRLMPPPQSRKKFDDLPEHVEAGLVTKIIKGETNQILSSMLEPVGFPNEEVAELYCYHREIELGSRAMTQTLLDNKYTL